jgi:hypothetical protein
LALNLGKFLYFPFSLGEKKERRAVAAKRMGECRDEKLNGKLGKTFIKFNNEPSKLIFPILPLLVLVFSDGR